MVSSQGPRSVRRLLADKVGFPTMWSPFGAGVCLFAGGPDFPRATAATSCVRYLNQSADLKDYGRVLGWELIPSKWVFNCLYILNLASWVNPDRYQNSYSLSQCYSLARASSHHGPFARKAKSAPGGGIT